MQCGAVVQDDPTGDLDEVELCLRQHGLAKFAKNFKDHDIGSLCLLKHCEEEDFRELGLSGAEATMLKGELEHY